MSILKQLIRKTTLTLIAFTFTVNALAASMDIANAPLITGTTTVVQPNIFLMMDDSGSMGWDYMPDDNGSSFFSTSKYGYASNQCNGVYYDPAMTYLLPVDSTGATYPTSSFTAARVDGFGATTAATIDLSQNFSLGQSTDNTPTTTGGGRAYYYDYTGTQNTEALKNFYSNTSTFFKECNSTPGSAPGNAVFRKIVLSPTETTTIGVGPTGTTTVNSITVNGTVITSGPSTNSAGGVLATSVASKISLGGFSATASGSTITITGPVSAANYAPVISQTGVVTFTTDVFPDTTAANLQNFANWYSYYRTRILMMKSAAGLAFQPVSTNYRVGFATMNNNNSADFVNLATFNAAQKTAWYDKLYKVTVGSSTPLLGALSDVGLMYANKLPGGKLNGVTAQDPIQLSCQQNFAILSTDGFWNSNTGNSNLAGQNVGQQDGTESFSPPRNDGANVNTTTTTTTVGLTQNQSVQNTTTTTPWTRTTKTIGGACSVSGVIPAGAAGAPMLDTADGSHKVALGTTVSSANPDSTRCFAIGTSSSTNHPWFCRGGNGGGTPAVTSASVTDASGTTYYVVNSGAGGAGCTTDKSKFGNNYSTTQGVCPGTSAVSGNTVTTQNQTYSQVVVNSTTTVNDVTTNTTTSVTNLNGINQPPVITNSSTTALVSTTPALVSNTGAPSPTTTWVNNGAAVAACTPAPLPTAGGSTPVSGTVVNSTATAVVTTLSGPVVTTPATFGGNPNPLVTQSSTGGTPNTLSDIAEYYYLTDLRTSALSNNLSNAPGYVGTDVAFNSVLGKGQDSASWQHMTTYTLGLGARGRMVFSPDYETGGNADYNAIANQSAAPANCSWQATGKCNWPVPNVAGVPENIDDLWHAAVNGRGTYFSASNPSDLATSLYNVLNDINARTGGAAAATTSNPNVVQDDNFIFSTSFETVDWTGQLISQQLDLDTGKLLLNLNWCADDTSIPLNGTAASCPTPNNLLDTLAANTPAGGSRNIYTFDGTATNGLKSFTYANLTAGQQAFFNQPATSALSQFCTSGLTCLTVWVANNTYAIGDEYRVGTTWYKVNTAYTSGATFGSADTSNTVVISGAAGANLVNYLRGDRTNEGISTSKYFRSRQLILGDIVNAEALYMKTPKFTFADPGYSTYKANKSSRMGMVYAAANDGMLHAFYAETKMMDSNGNVVTTGGTNFTGGSEAWAYVPTFVLPNLHKLSDKNYANQHTYFVDGTPISGDICTSNCTNAATAVWKTILVGGLNAGGKGYYALDISNPAQPKALWEFTDTNMGLTYGNPEIAKVCDDSTCATKTWAVLVTSGYNNADGIGHLYVINAATGVLIRDITTTGVNNSGTPSGLSKIIAQVVSETDNTVLQVYGGDNLGNLWRFDVNDKVGATGYDAQLLITLKDAAGTVQPITTKPQVGIYNNSTLVLIGTGRYLGTSDLASTGTQTLYGIKDPLATGTTPSTAVYSVNPHSTSPSSGFVQQNVSTSVCPANTQGCSAGETIRTGTSRVVNLASSNGWYIDMPDSGERSNTDSTLQLGTLGLTTNVPGVSACTVGGYSYTYNINFSNGAPIGTNIIGTKIANALATRPVFVGLPNGTVIEVIRTSDGSTVIKNPPIGLGTAGTRRITKRELISQ
jgi:type IV pilus assembly protein PilY1